MQTWRTLCFYFAIFCLLTLCIIYKNNECKYNCTESCRTPRPISVEQKATSIPSKHHSIKDDMKKNKTIRITIFRNSPGYDPYYNFNFNQCEYTNCLISKDISFIKESDAVLFFYHYLGDPGSVPSKQKNQLWIIYTFGSPDYYQELSPEWNNMFDLCVTYRKDSEIDSWFKITKRKQPLKKDFSKSFKLKTKFAAWVVSHCYTTSKRNEYVKELQKYMNVDIYGKCGTNLTACRKISHKECHEMLSKEYKFYLGFENSLCKDYVTEKVMCSYYDNHDSIVVYRGAPNVHELLPKHTYIDTRKYGEPKRLADFLLQLATNESEYISYLSEKSKYTVDMDNESRYKCNLCKFLNTCKGKQFRWPARDFNGWYRGNGTCEVPTDIPDN